MGVPADSNATDPKPVNNLTLLSSAFSLAVKYDKTDFNP
jgi:hypothetical protein